MMRNKNILNKLKRNYYKVPTKIHQMGLNSTSISLYYLLASFAEEFNPSIRFLQKKLDLSRPTVIKYLKILETKNIIRKYHQGGQNDLNKYEFVNPGEWK